MFNLTMLIFFVEQEVSSVCQPIHIEGGKSKSDVARVFGVHP